MTILRTNLKGRDLLGSPELNKGTAFSANERTALGLLGLLPERVETIEEQLVRVRTGFDSFHDDLERHVFLRALQDTNEVLFFRFLREHLTEVMPIIYTPTVGEACQHFSRIYRRPHGLFLSYPDRERMQQVIASVPGEIDVVVVTDGERILGLGDQGLGGMGIPIGKLSLYTVAGGIDPSRALPVLLDLGTNNPDLLADPLYLGWRHERIDGDEYTAFTDRFVTAVKDRWPKALLQWEDFARRHATTLLQRHQNAILSFNDDIQGTAAISLATIEAALKVAGSRLESIDVVIVGAGSAGAGIAGMLRQAGITRRRLFMVDSHGLLHDRLPRLADFQAPFAQPWDAVASWANPHGPTSLDDTVDRVEPTVLVGVSGQRGLFGETLIRRLARGVERPIVLPLSNPTSRSEAEPQQILDWTGGRAIVATGSPFPQATHGGNDTTFSQANNVYIFPGLGLGALIAGATSVTDAMLGAAASAVTEPGPGGRGDARNGILPPLGNVTEVSRRVAIAVAKQAIAEGAGEAVDDEVIEARLKSRWWDPVYSEVTPE